MNILSTFGWVNYSFVRIKAWKTPPTVGILYAMS